MNDIKDSVFGIVNAIDDLSGRCFNRRGQFWVTNVLFPLLNLFRGKNEEFWLRQNKVKNEKALCVFFPKAK